MDKKQDQKISLFSFILIIMSSVFGFPNTAIAFNQMGFASIVWYIFAAVTFFLPTSFMFAEYGSAIKDDHGGVYTWLDESIGTKWAFIGSFIWLCQWILIIVDSAPRIWVAASTLIFGHDVTNHLQIGVISNNGSIAIISSLLILLMTFIATKGLKSITILASVGGAFITFIALLFCGISLVIMAARHGQLVEPIHGIRTFIESPNPQFRGGIATMSFVVYAIYAYGGIESAGGLIDKLKNPRINFPRGIIISAIMITALYVLSIFLFGFSFNWTQVVGKNNVNLQNILFVLMYNVGAALGHSLNLSPMASMEIGRLVARIAGLSILIGTIGTVAVIIYSPLKSFILGSPARFWPKKVIKLNRNDMPANAMWIQGLIISFILIFTAFGGYNAQQFYEVLTDMTNISNAFPYVFLVLAFPFFKNQTDLERPFVFYKNRQIMYIVVTIVLIVLTFGIMFNLIQPILEHDYKTAFWTFIGPVFFGGLAWCLYKYSQIKLQNKQ